MAREARAQLARRVLLARAPDLGETLGLGEEVRRHQHQAAEAMVRHAAGVMSGDTAAVAVAEQDAARKPIASSSFGTTSTASALHVVERTRQRDRRTTARSRCANRRKRRCRCAPRAPRKCAPRADRAEALMQHDDGRRRAGGGGADPCNISSDAPSRVEGGPWSASYGRSGLSFALAPATGSTLIPQLEPLDLAGRRLRQRLHDLDPARISSTGRPAA